MRRIVVRAREAAIVMSIMAMALANAGTVAAAPDVVGDTYGDAANAISESGGIPVIAARVGNQLAEDDCIVTNAWDASFVRDTGDEFGPDDGEIMVALNCNGGYATTTAPGASVQSEAGRDAKAADEAAEADEAE